MDQSGHTTDWQYKYIDDNLKTLWAYNINIKQFVTYVGEYFQMSLKTYIVMITLELWEDKYSYMKKLKKTKYNIKNLYFK